MVEALSIQQGIEAWQHGRRAEALQTYERIIQRRPSNPTR